MQIENYFNHCHKSDSITNTKKVAHKAPCILLSVTVHDQHLKKAYRETPAETA